MSSDKPPLTLKERANAIFEEWAKTPVKAAVDLFERHLTEQFGQLVAERDSARTERNIMLKWLRTVDEFDKFLGVQNDASPAFTLNMWTEKVQELRNEVERLRGLCWQSVLCGNCGERYLYNRADDPGCERDYGHGLGQCVPGRRTVATVDKP